MKPKKYHRQCFKFLIQYGKAKSGYEIAKKHDNVNNDNLYNDALKDFERENSIEYKSGFWIMKEQYECFRDKQWQSVFLQNDKIIDLVLTNKKLTFVEWLKEFEKIKKMIIADKLASTPFARKAIRQAKKNGLGLFT